MELRRLAKELLESGRARMVVGYGPGRKRARALFARTAEDADRLILDATCDRNLATCLAKEEVRHLGPLALVALPDTLRALLQLMAERQVRDGEVLALVPEGDAWKVLATGAEMEAHAALLVPARRPGDAEMLERLAAMTVQERWAFWRAELSRCVKCYACRATCPMCYCAQCTMDCNRPQWVPVASHDLGNLEYHLVRAMHLAGRCVTCGDCGRACPVGIPVHLLTFHAQDSVFRQFGQKAGASQKLDYALSTFRPDDKESFIR